MPLKIVTVVVHRVSHGKDHAVLGKLILHFFPSLAFVERDLRRRELRDFRGRVFPGGPALCQGEFIRGVTGLANGLFTP